MGSFVVVNDGSMLYLSKGVFINATVSDIHNTVNSEIVMCSVLKLWDLPTPWRPSG